MKLGKLGLLSLPLVFVLTACPGPIDPRPGDRPVINSFDADPDSIATPGEEVRLTWDVTNADTLTITSTAGDEIDVTGETETIVTPEQTTTYTLVASNEVGDAELSTTVTVGEPGTDTGGNGEPQPDQDPEPDGTFGVSLSPDGPFLNDRPGGIQSPDDERVITVQPGATFYAQVNYVDEDGIEEVVVRLVNSEPAGFAADLVEGQEVNGFTLLGPVDEAACDLSTAPTEFECVYEIEVGEDVVNIDQLEGAGDEFAYVFRTLVTDTAGNLAEDSIRGYVVVE